MYILLFKIDDMQRSVDVMLCFICDVDTMREFSGTPGCEPISFLYRYKISSSSTCCSRGWKRND